MSIERYATHDVLMISENASLDEAAILMRQKNVGALVIVKDKEKDLTPVGIVTDRDIVTKLFAKEVDLKKIRVKEILTQDLLVIKHKQDMQETINALAKKGVRRAPIVDDNNRVIGIITLDDLLLVVSKELQGLANLIRKQTPIDE